MKLNHPDHDLHIPDAMAAKPALARTTHLGIGAHQDDLEFMAMHGILECFRQTERWFGGIICTDGAGSPRTGPYAQYSDEEMKTIRLSEQHNAANVGQFSFVAQLAHPSSCAKSKDQRTPLIDDLFKLLDASRPEIVYTHNPADKHPTHIGVLLATLEAIHRMPAATRPKCLLGCEVWRGLDWLPDADKTVLDTSAHPNLSASLNGLFDSQISGGKRYDLAVEGRRRANATFHQSHATDTTEQAIYAWDLTPLISENPPSLQEFVGKTAKNFADSLVATINSLNAPSPPEP